MVQVRPCGFCCIGDTSRSRPGHHLEPRELDLLMRSHVDASSTIQCFVHGQRMWPRFSLCNIYPRFNGMVFILLLIQRRSRTCREYGCRSFRILHVEDHHAHLSFPWAYWGSVVTMGHQYGLGFKALALAMSGLANCPMKLLTYILVLVTFRRSASLTP